MNYKFIKSIINSIEEFENEGNNNANINDFRIWLNQKEYLSESPQSLSEKFELDVNNLDNEICKQVIMMGRYTKMTIRKGLSIYPDLSNEDFTYLFRLMDYDSLTKMQLIEKNAHEKQTGIEIIKRMIKNGIFEEFPDPNDGRSKRIKVTKYGIDLFYKSMRDVSITSKILGGNLSENEKEDLLSLLKKLNEFHNTIYHNMRESNVDELYELVK